MRVDKNISMFVGNDKDANGIGAVSGLKNENKSQSKASLFAGDLGLNQDRIQLKRQLAQKQATKIINQTWASEQEIDSDLEARRRLIRDLQESNSKSYDELDILEQEKKELQELYGVEDDSQEQKDLELLIRKNRSMGMYGEPAEFTKEERERLSEIMDGERTEYQTRCLNIDSRGNAHRESIGENNQRIRGEASVIRGIKLERLKREPMLKAKGEAEEILEAAGKEVLGMMFEDAKDHIDEEMQEKIDEAKEAKEEKEERQEVIDRIKDKAEEKEEEIELLEEVENVIISSDSTLEDIQNEIKSLVSKLGLIEEDLKGNTVDKGV